MSKKETLNGQETGSVPVVDLAALVAGLSLEQLKALTAQAAQRQNAERAQALEKVRALIDLHGFTLAEIGFQRSVVPLYKDPASQATWSGRGREPAWVAAAGGKDKCRITPDNPLA